ncbi:hypothetical protein ABPG77_006840 [Micractinium sp. CCAP 211/92]
MASSVGKPVVKVDIWSDLSCPWCWVGKKRFDKAVEQLQDEADFDITYHAYVIDHGTAPQGEAYLDYNLRRWGSDGWCDGLRHSGRPDGASFGDWRWWPNSVRAHQLLLLAQEQGKGREAKEALLRATYEEGKNISGVEALLEVAAGLGLTQSREELRRCLESDAGRAAVLEDDRLGKKELGISGVPYFIVGAAGDSGRRYALSGAQPASAFAKAFAKVLAEQGD